MVEPSDIVAITQVVNLYGHVLDARDWDRLPEVFTDDGVFDLSDIVIPGAGSPVHEGLPAVRRAFERADHALAHHCSNVYVYEADGRVRVLSKFFTPASNGSMSSGADYDDVVIRTADGWRIQHRRVIRRRQVE